jgi:diguanylate cyclase (GGDEF)-like protein
MSDRLRLATEHAARDNAGMAVLFLDLNGFKAVNDRLGHDAGDEVLRVTARRLTEHVRGGDVVARLGGDEFVVIATCITPNGAGLLGRRLLRGLGMPITIDGEAVTVPASIGIAVSIGAEQPDDLLRAADAAMYQAKQQRRGMVFAAHPAPPATRTDCTG